MNIATSPHLTASSALLAPMSRAGTRGDSDWERERHVLAARAAADLAFGDVVGVEELERLAEEAIDELWDGPLRVTAFVTILALRRIREKVAKTHGVGLPR